MGRKGQQTERITINVTPEQEKAFGAMLDSMIEDRKKLHAEFPTFYPLLSRNDIMVEMLKCAHYDYFGNSSDWPEHVKAQGQRTDLKPAPKV